MKILNSLTIALVSIVALCSVSCTEVVQINDGQQEKNSNKEPLSIEVTVSEVTHEAAFASIGTSNDESTYYSSVISKSDYNMIGSDEALIEEDKEFFKYLARKEGKSYEQVLEFMLSRGNQEEKFVNLVSNTEYYVYAYGMDTDGEVTGEITLTGFRTGKQPGEPITFEMRMDEYRDTYAAVYTKPSVDTVWYTSGMLPEYVLAQYGGSTEYIKLFAMEALLSHADFVGLDVSDIINIVCSKGESLIENDELDPETTYYAYSVAVNNEGKPISEVGAHKFTTAMEGMHGFSIDMTLLEYKGATAYMEYKPSDPKNTYVTWKYPSDIVESFDNDEDLKEWVLEDIGSSIRYWLIKGTYRQTIANLLYGSDYYVIAIGYDEEEGPTTPLYKEKIRLPDPDNFNFNFTVELIKMGALVTVFPSENLARYVTGITDKAAYDSYGGSLEDLFKEQLDAYREYNPTYTQEQIVQSFTKDGQQFITQEYLYSDTQYYAWAACVNREGDFVTDVTVKEFISKKHELNDDYVNVSTYMYDGMDVSEQSFIYNDYRDYAILHVTVEPSSEDVSYVPWVYAGNIEDNTGEYSDDFIRYDLINYKSKMISRQIIYAIPWDTEFTLCIATVNDNLECGKVYRKAMTLRKEDALPVNQFEHMWEFPTCPNLTFGPERSYAKEIRQSYTPENRLQYIPDQKLRSLESRNASGENQGKTVIDWYTLNESELVRFSKKMVKERLL